MNSDSETKLRLPADYLRFADKTFTQLGYAETIGTYCSIWIIDNFSEIKEEKCIEGPIFETDQHTWRLVLYPRGNKDSPDTCMSLYIQNEDNKNSEESTEDVCAAVALCIVDPQDPTHIFHKVVSNRFSRYESDWGFNEFINLDILNGDEPFLINDTLMLVSIVQLKKDTTGVLWHSFTMYDSKKMTGHVGLLNQGATCYMNSLFQSLFFTNIYRKSVYQIPTENDDPRNSIALALQRLFYNLQFSDSAVSTTEMTQSFGWSTLDTFMQHDVQEFNRLLQEHVENKMVETPAEGTIKQIFVGRIKSYIKCIDVDYESSRSEDFYDIQLNVKGCRDLQASFEDYVREEVLEKENKYMAEGHGLQDAKKGVVFEAFPPVLQIQLKRFEYDMTKDAMVKINDRHEFPAEISLQPYHVSRDQVPSNEYNYILHGVLVHSGDPTGGHYFAFVRPTKEDEWFEFNDDRVTPATLDEVLEYNYGGQTLDKRSSPDGTNAYMLVYIRQSCQDQVLKPVTKNDIPQHLIQRIEEEKERLALIEKEMAERHLYMRMLVVTEDDFMQNTETGFISSNQSPPIQPVAVLRSQTLREYLTGFALQYQVDIETIRVWYMDHDIRGPDDARPEAPIPLDLYDNTLEQLHKVGSSFPMLRLYIEDCSDAEAPPDPSSTLLFIKFFDPDSQTLSNVGKLYVNMHALVESIFDSLNTMVEYPIGSRLLTFLEANDTCVDRLPGNWTFSDVGVKNGDILCFQKRLTHNQMELLFTEGKYFSVHDYYEYLGQRVEVEFQPRDAMYQRGPTKGSITLELRLDMPLEVVLARLGYCIQADPDTIQLFYPNYPDKRPLLRSVNPQDAYRLTDILEYSPTIDFCDSYNEMQYTDWVLYYDVLPMSIIGSRERLIRIHVCDTFDQPQTRAVLLPVYARISDLCQAIAPPSTNVRIFITESPGLSTVEVLDPNGTIGHHIKQDEEDLYAEITPKEELDIGQEDFFITVFHYQENLTQTHSIPFRFLIIKDETLSQTKKRLQQRVGMDDEAWSKVGFSALVNKFKTTDLVQDDSQTSTMIRNATYSLGLEHTDPQGRYKPKPKNGHDKGLYIKH